MEKLVTIDIIGTGNVGTHLYRAFEGKADVNNVPSRTLDSLRTDSDIYLISVSDDAIRKVSGKVSDYLTHVCKSILDWKNDNAIIAHTSGTTPLSVISDLYPATGVFYPLQTFSKGVELNYSEIPLFIEGASADVAHRLTEVAKLITEKVYDADSEKRKTLHIASVFACNFANHLWALSEEFLAGSGLSFDMLRPLIMETCRKAGRISPYDGQTGPAVRHDMKTIQSHETALAANSDPELLEIYKLLTDSIIKRHSAK